MKSNDVCARHDVVVENEMQHLRHLFVSTLSGLREQWRSVGIASLVALLLYSVPIGFVPVSKAQTSSPSATIPGFLPAKPFRYRNSFPPYPKESLRFGEEGVVSVQISITANGRISEVRLTRSSGSSRLDWATVRWIGMRWRYHPATLNGQPVASTINLRVKFAIQK